MKRVLIVVMMLLIASTTMAGEISQESVKSFFDTWLTAQNNGSFSRYADMYSKKFVGIRRSGKSTRKFDYDTWLKDRKNMFKKKMLVVGNFPEVNISGNTASVKFEQTWESATYKDVGNKILYLALEDGKLRIIREEMLFSKMPGGKGHSSKFTSIRDNDCHKVGINLLMHFTGAESALECPAPKGWRLFKVYDRDSERSWINIANSHSVWSTAEQVRIDRRYFFGYFPNVDCSPRVEWKMSAVNTATTLIFRVAAADPKFPEKWSSRLYVIDLEGDEPSFCGFASTNEEATTIANYKLNCTEPLSKEVNF